MIDASFLISLFIKSFVVLGAGAIAAALLRGRGAATKHTVWMAAFAALAVLPACLLWMPAIAAPMGRFVFITGATGNVAGFGSAVPSLLWFWLAGAALFGARLAVGHARVAGIVRRAREIERTSGVTIRETTDGCLPLTYGLISPIILVPPAAREWPRTLRESVVHHELAHIERGDTWWLLLTQVLCCLYWFQPLVWWAAKRAALEREHACDDAVLSSGGASHDYATHLVELARTTLSAPWPVAAVVRRSDLETRVGAILDPRRNRSRAGRLTWSLALAAAIAVLLPLAAMRAQEAEKLYKVEGGVTAPKLIHKVEPKYTEQARDAMIEGVVRLRCAIDTKGYPIDITIIGSLEPGLDNNAIEAVSQWRFEPGQLKGKPVAVQATIEVNFRLL